MNIWFVKPVLDLFWILSLFLIGLWGFFKDPIWKGRGRTLLEAFSATMLDPEEIETKASDMSVYEGLGKTLTWLADLIAISLMDLLALLNKMFGLLALGLSTSYLLNWNWRLSEIALVVLGVLTLVIRVVFEKRNYKISFLWIALFKSFELVGIAYCAINLYSGFVLY